VARVSLPAIAICATIKALTGAMDELTSGLFTKLVEDGRLASGQEIGRLTGS